MIRSTLIILFLLILPLQAEIVVSADLVDYDGSRVDLRGNVQIEHDMGKMSSDTAYFHRLPGEEEDFSVLRLEGNVEITLPDGALLDCDTAEFNGADSTGLFYSGESEPVSYTTVASNAQGESKALAVRGSRMRIAVGEGIEAMEAEEEVEIEYDGNITARTHKIWYEPKEKAKAPAGLYHLVPKEGELCEVETAKGDQVAASTITIDSENSTIILEDADGALAMEESEQVHFRSNKLTWQERGRKLDMEGRVMVLQKGFGKLTSNRKISVHLDEEQPGNRMKAMESHGKTVLTFINDRTSEQQTVTCFGTVQVDHPQMKTTLSSPRGDGKVPQELRVKFQDRRGFVTADEVVVWYEETADKPVIDKLVLTGNVYMYNNAPSDPEDTTVVEQYALADKVEYDPNSGQMMLSMEEEEGRVLYFDEVQGVEVSATGIEVWRDQASGKQAVKGFGDVRFSLESQELEQMKQLFRVHDSMEESTREETVWLHRSTLDKKEPAN